MPRSSTLRVSLATLTLLLGACGGDAEDTDATPSDTTAAAQPASGPDTSMAGMQPDSAQDPNQQFLRMMVDHHQGLIVMAQQAAERGSTDSVKSEARELHTKQTAEQRQMLDMLQRQYGDTHQPMVMPAHQAMADSLTQKQGADYDMTFRMNVVQHHREGIQMTDQHLPHLTQPELRSMAERMKTEQQSDIQKLQAAMGHG
jgi:uncharacterized protein (DUF305 family)